jgi:hypothetical protein
MNKVLLVVNFFIVFNIYNYKIKQINEELKIIYKELNKIKYKLNITEIKINQVLYEKSLNNEELIIYKNNIEKTIIESKKRYDMGLQAYSN